MFLSPMAIKRKKTKGKNKIRKYNRDYIAYGFTCEYLNGEESPQCVICRKVLANESMLPNKLKRHLSTTHPSLVDKSKEYFKNKLSELKCQKSTITAFSRNEISQRALMASYKVAYCVAKCKKPHTIAKELIQMVRRYLFKSLVGSREV